MTTSLLSWLSKSSSAIILHPLPTDQLHQLHRCRCYRHLRSSIPSEIPSPSSSTGLDSSLEQHHNYPQILNAPHKPRSFHFPPWRRSFGNKNVVKQGFNTSWFDSHVAHVVALWRGFPIEKMPKSWLKPNIIKKLCTVVALPKDYRDCAELRSSQHAKELYIPSYN